MSAGSRGKTAFLEKTAGPWHWRGQSAGRAIYVAYLISCGHPNCQVMRSAIAKRAYPEMQIIIWHPIPGHQSHMCHTKKALALDPQSVPCRFW